ncbi:MAG TPA: AAA family ATPase, partial [Thermodesulfovibrionales bacterium]|nr:AAA family ATPase [Thermodesulfovibrionales bacterium]
EFGSKVEDLKNRMARAREELASASSRLTSLKEIMHEEFSKEILTEAERLHILSSVAEVIEVEEAYEKAIENALAEKVKGFILSSFDDIADAVALCKQKGMGRTVFIPRDAVVSAGAHATEPVEAVLGKAGDFVKVQPEKREYFSVIEALLHNVYIVRDLPAAFAHLTGENRATFVTLDGEIAEPSGAVTVGEGRGVLKRKREIRELDALTGEKKAEIERLEGALAQAGIALEDRKGSLKDIESAIVGTEKEISLLRLTADTQGEEKERTSRKLSYLHIEQEEVLREKESLRATVVEKESAIERMQAKKALAEQEIKDIQDAVARDRESYEMERSSVTELRLSLNSFRERIEGIKKEIETAAAILSDLSQTGERLTHERTDIEARIARCGEDVQRNTEVLKELVVSADSLRERISGEREIIHREAEEVARTEQVAKALRVRLDSLTSRTAELEVSLAEHRVRLEGLTEGIRQNYGIEIASFEAGEVAAEDEERLASIREKIQELGLVNLGTLEEYEELKTRYEFLSKQQEDLNKSIAELEEAITKINSTTRKKLRDAFEQLSAKFSEVFVYLFGGGKAELVLTDEHNILDTGIDIIAQPPGKKLQNINLLSGGEKALTALSLLFASFLIKPSPLCVLDEVDAPLDEANVGRFGRMLRELSDKIQFIVVTHNRVTMEAADYIYGITMEEPGVSKVISMHLVDTA